MAPGGKIRIRVAAKALAEMKHRVRGLTRRIRGRSLGQIAQDLRSYLLGWKIYFRLADTPKIFGELDEWIRHRLRAIQLKQWKQGRTVYRELMARGIGRDAVATVARFTRCWWKNSAKTIHLALPNRLFDELGVPRLGA